MLMEVSGRNMKSLDGFYNELRQKYPNTFSLAPELGTGNREIHKLPQLECTTPLLSRLNLPNGISPQRVPPDSLVCKVQILKTQHGQNKKSEMPQHTVIIQDKAVPVPAVSRRDHLAPENGITFRLPSLRAQVEQNKAELRNRLNTLKEGDGPLQTGQNGSATARLTSQGKNTQNYSSSENIFSSHTSRSPTKPDVLGTIMKELLPSKPGRLTNQVSLNSREQPHRNGPSGCVSDSDSGVSACSPIKVFRPKLRSPQTPPAPSDIKRNFTFKSQAAYGPVKANHAVIPGQQVPPMKLSESTDLSQSIKSSSINFGDRIKPRPPTARVRFEDESEQEAESRYQERFVIKMKEAEKFDKKSLSSTSTPSMDSNRRSMNSLSCHSTLSMDSSRRSLTSPTPPSPSQSDRAQTGTQPTTGHPYRRQPFPPSVAKKVLIDVPRSGQPHRYTLYNESSRGEKLNNQVLPRSSKELASHPGVSRNFATNNREFRSKEQSMSEKKESDKVEQGNPPVRAKVGETGEGVDISIYSRVKKSLHVTRKVMSQSEKSDLLNIDIQFVSELETSQSLQLLPRGRGQEKVALDRNSHSGSSSPVPLKEFLQGEGAPTSSKRSKKTEEPTSAGPPMNRMLKAPLLPMRMMHSFLKKGRAKNYMVPVPPSPRQMQR
ncbi:serine/arginine repetitive matrix protein 1-like isoform X2 [Xenopus laevis]|nr:serine/arginine repetitive matrix protein 1-like isoform X2 [Xenopus laevis]